MGKKTTVYRNLVLVLLLSLFFSLQPAYAVSDDTVLKKDMSGGRVAELQKGLKQLGFFSQSPTGYYGEVTEAAVIDFQKEYGLAADGMAGESTFDKLNNLLEEVTNRPLLKKGMNSPQVAALQSDLKQLGFFALNPTGYYGDATEDAVVKLQKKHGMDPDGKVGTDTYKRIDILLKRVESVKIVVDPGHGGIDVGASKGNILESEVNLSVSKKLKAYLEEYGYEVTLTRSKDIALDSLSKVGRTRQERDLNARTNIIGESGAELFVSIHVNSLPESPSTSGSIVYYNDKYPGSRELAQNLQKALNSVTASGLKRQSHDCEKAEYYILRNSTVPGVLVETAFVTNKKERELLATDSFREKLAKAILAGIEKTVASE